MLNPNEAWQKIAAVLSPLGVVDRPRRSTAHLVLGRDMVATIDVPGSDVSAMDGYALRPAEHEQREFAVVGTIAAGQPPGFELEPGKAVRIMTGAPVPSDAERVVPIEQTDRGTDHVRVEDSAEPGAHIRRRGEILEAGDPLLARGTLLTPGALGLLATHGISDVPVVRPPKVAILTTGDEIVPPEETPAPGQLRDSHTDFLVAAVRSTFAEAEALGIAPDDPAQLRQRIGEGFSADVLLLSGGVSMGEFDLVEGVLAEAGCSVLFDAVAIQPGKPMVAAIREGTLIFGLPGNPASAMVCFWLFVRPALRRLMGIDDAFWKGALPGRLVAPMPGARSRDLFLPAEIRFQAGEILVRPHPPRGSHDLVAYGRGTALVRAPAHSEPSPAGRPCEILPLGDWVGTS